MNYEVPCNPVKAAAVDSVFPQPGWSHHRALRSVSHRPDRDGRERRARALAMIIHLDAVHGL